MNILQMMKMVSRFTFLLLVLKMSCSFVVAENFEYSVSEPLPLFDIYKHDRQRREVSPLPAQQSLAPAAATTTASVNTTDSNKTTINNEKPGVVPEQHLLGVNGSGILHGSKTPKVSDPISASDAPVVDQHLLGVNGSGILHENENNATAVVSDATTNDEPRVVPEQHLLGVNGSGILHDPKTPKVSDPISTSDDITNVFKETPEIIKAEQNLANLTYDDHNFYKSSFIGNVTYFQEYWTNISKAKAEPHEVLSNSHRHASTCKLSFDFPFYGHDVRNITVATGGFLYTGDLVHNWLAATQYISPLMANFDTTITNDSLVKMYDDGEKFTVFWENATLQEAPTKTFTFAVTLYKNGDIVFAYKDIPIPVQSIQDEDHPVKVGISDAYLKDKILFFVRRKTIYEYHRVSFKDYEITNNTLLRLTALPTCLQYNTCQSCVNHETEFNCTWCEQIRKCSSGTDRNKQDWLLRNCDKVTIATEDACPAVPNVDAPSDVKTAYATDDQAHRVADVRTLNAEDGPKKSASPITAPISNQAQQKSSVGGAVTAFVIITLICCFGGWLLYAFKNPLSRSGQILIRYRPSTWGWRRGEARYTAATIHM